MAEVVSQKRVLIDKANSNMFAMICVAVALVVFSLVSIRALYAQSAHRSHVIAAKRSASSQLSSNDIEIGKLITSFKAFDDTPESVLGTSEKNSKIVLDALPSSYDFPALATSLEKILTEGGYNIDSISGTDAEASTDSATGTSSPEPVEIPFSISVTGSYDKIKNLPVDLERSIRPITVVNVELSGSAGNAKLSLEAKTYYQPSKTLNLRYREVK